MVRPFYYFPRIFSVIWLSAYPLWRFSVGILFWVVLGLMYVTFWWYFSDSCICGLVIWNPLLDLCQLWVKAVVGHMIATLHVESQIVLFLVESHWKQKGLVLEPFFWVLEPPRFFNNQVSEPAYHTPRLILGNQSHRPLAGAPFKYRNLVTKKCSYLVPSLFLGADSSSLI